MGLRWSGMVPANASSDGVIAGALEAQRACTGRVLTRVRLGGVGAALVLAIVMGDLARQSDWRVLTPVLAVWGAGAVLLAALAERSVRG